MSNSERQSILAALADAQWLSGFARGLAENLVQEGSIVRLDAGVWAHGEGDEATGLIVVAEGALNLFCEISKDREVLVGHAPAGVTIGQTVSFGGGPRLVTAISVAPSLVLKVSDAALGRVARKRPEIWRALARLAYFQLSVALRVNAELIGLPPRAKLASRLLMLAGPRNAHIVLSQHALAEMIGLSRKTVNVYLRGFETAGLVRTVYGGLDLTDRRALAKIAAG